MASPSAIRRHYGDGNTFVSDPAHANLMALGAALRYGSGDPREGKQLELIPGQPVDGGVTCRNRECESGTVGSSGAEARS